MLLARPHLNWALGERQLWLRENPDDWSRILIMGELKRFKLVRRALPKNDRDWSHD